MTLYTYLSLDPNEIARLSSEDAQAQIQSSLTAKIAETDVNTNQLLKSRADVKARIAAYLLSVPEIRAEYDAAISGLSEDHERDITQAVYDDGKASPETPNRVGTSPIESIHPELISSSAEVNFLASRYRLSDEQIASIVTRLAEIPTNYATNENLFRQPNAGERTIQKSFDLLRTNPEKAHVVLPGMLKYLNLTDAQLAEIISAVPNTQIDQYDFREIFSQPNLGPESFSATQQLIENNAAGLSRHLAVALVQTRKLSDGELSQIIATLPENQDFESSLYFISNFDHLGPAAASSFLRRVIDAGIYDDDITLPLVDSRSLSGDQLATLLTRKLDSEWLSQTQRKILSLADRNPEIKKAFLKSVADTKQLNTEALEILMYQTNFEDHEIAQIFANTTTGWQRTEAEKLFLGNNVRFGPEATDVLVRDVDGMRLRGPQSLERLLRNTQISDAQTARLLEATVTDQEAYEMWDVLAQYGSFGSESFGKMESLSHQMPTLRPTFVKKLADSFSPHPIPDEFAATVLRTTQHTVLANEIRLALVEKQRVGMQTFNELTSQFSKTQNVDKNLVYTLVTSNNFEDEDLAQLIQSTAQAHAGAEIRMMIADRQQLGPRSIAAMTQALRSSQYLGEELGVLECIARSGMHQDGREMIAGAFQNSHLADRANQMLGVNNSGQNFGYNQRGW